MSLFERLQTSRLYDNTGMHFDFSNCMTTSSEAIRPIFPKMSCFVLFHLGL